MSNKHKAHAEKCAKTINRYWSERGFDANATVTEREATKKVPVYAIRSDLVNGLPLGAKSLDALAAHLAK